MKWRVVAWLLLGILLAVFLFLSYIVNEINDEIDKCGDPTSGKYIEDPDLRAKECERR